MSIQIVLEVVALSDGRLVSSSCDATIRIWDAALGSCLSVSSNDEDNEYYDEAAYATGVRWHPHPCHANHDLITMRRPITRVPIM